MEKGKKEVVMALNTSVQELQKGINVHCGLLAALMDEQVDAERLQAKLAQCPERAREVKLRKAIKEAIDVIEETRRSFKSKQLEALRKRLTQVLIDID